MRCYTGRAFGSFLTILDFSIWSSLGRRRRRNPDTSTLRCLARRHQALTAEIAELDAAIGELCALASPALLAARGVGPDVASALLVAAGDNPGRLRTERHSPHCAAPAPSRRPRARSPGTG